MMNSSSYGSNDLYRTDNRTMVATQLQAKAEAEKAAAEARQAQWEARIAAANADATEAAYYANESSTNFTNIVADDYESAYARRLQGFSSPTYHLPSSYYSLATSDAMFYATAYDPAFYNVMVSGDQVWVEPKYITSMFGTWGATNVTYGLYADPWTFGWSYYVDPFYYSWWGYPRYSWYDWNWTICYNWYWGPGFYPYYPGFYPGFYPYYPGFYPMYPPHHPAPPPPHRPHHPHNGHDNLNGHRSNTGSRYTSPTSNRNYGASQGDRRGHGVVSTGVNDRRTAVRPSGNSNNTQRGTRVDGGTTTHRYDNYRQGGSSSRSSSTSSSPRRNTTTQSTTNRGTNTGYRGGSTGGHVGGGGGGMRGGTTSSRR